MIQTMPYRHVHLDFHTSEQIRNIGAEFSKKQFQQMLKLGNVNCITLFSKCHHGVSYHPTKVGLMHPHLKFNLLAEQMDACRQINVQTPIYISAGLDEYYYHIHPGDALVPKTGQKPLEVGFKRLCFNTKYLDYLCAQIEECLDMFNPFWLFLDIIGIAPCYCNNCRQDMMKIGMDPGSDEDAYDFASRVQENYFKRTLAAARKKNKKMRIFQNAGHIYKGDRNFLKYVSHLELESLPTGGWGYDHFPGSAKYTACLGVDFCGMTGKFHTSWGEFGGFKHKNALRYETSAMLAYGARCSIGDQLHPSGKLNEDTYRLMGIAYSQVQKKEPFCYNAAPVSQIALLSSESLKFRANKTAHATNVSNERDGLADTGVMRMLLEKQVMFDIIDSQMPFGKYKLIIVPDDRCLDEKTAEKLQKYMDKGGKVLLSYQAGLKPDSDDLYFDIGQYEGVNRFDPEYLKIKSTVLKQDRTGNLIKSPFVVYGGSVNIKTDSRVCVDKLDPYFNRTLKHFCSHQHAPEDKRSRYPAVFIKGNICYFANRIFSAYKNQGQMLYRDLVYTVMEKFIGGFSIYTSLQSAGRISLMEQKEKRRFILHLMYAAPVKRAGNAVPAWGLKDIEVIEDIIKLSDIKCGLKTKKKIKRVTEALTDKSLDFTQTGGNVEFVVPEIDCHQMIVLEY